MIHFFGDSWTAEYSELEMIYKVNNWPMDDLKSWPALVGELLGCEIVNHAENGHSQGDMLYQLSTVNINSGDIAIFALTAPSRRFYVDWRGIPKRIQHDLNKDGLNDNHDSWISVINMLALEKICEIKNIRSYFLCMFDISNLPNTEQHIKNLWTLLDNDKWLLPPNTNVVFELFDKEWFGRYQEYNNSDFLDWLHTNNEQVKTLIHPCEQHPNQKGKQLIAEFVSQKILQKDLL